LVMRVPPEARGRELTKAEMEAFGASLHRFEIYAIN